MIFRFFLVLSAPGTHFGAILESFWSYFGTILELKNLTFLVEFPESFFNDFEVDFWTQNDVILEQI